MKKVCSRCREEMPSTAFNKKADRKDGLQSACRVCYAASDAPYREIHREQANARAAAWYMDNRERALARFAIYYKAHSKHMNTRAAEWRKVHAADVNTHGHRRRARQRGAPGSHTTAEWQALVSECGGRCAYCDEGKPLARDHVIPLVRGGSNDISNIVPACKSCNSSKKAKTGTALDVWLREMGRSAVWHVGI